MLLILTSYIFLQKLGAPSSLKGNRCSFLFNLASEFSYEICNSSSLYANVQVVLGKGPWLMVDAAAEYCCITMVNGSNV